ncbi:hypothetical protein glysoja_047451, partial [Glycine soja]
GGVHYVKGNKAIKENDFGEAADNFSRAHEIRVAHYGELAPECVHTYYKYGCALLYKAQEDADPLADVPKKEDGSQHGSNKDGSVKSSLNYIFYLIYLISSILCRSGEGSVFFN